MDVLKLDQKSKAPRAKTWITLDKIQHAMGWSAVEMAERMLLTQKRFEFLRSRNIEPSLYAVTKLLDQLGLSVDKVILGNIDFLALQRHKEGDLFFLPERYQTAAFSRRRTSIHLLEYLESHFGWEMKKKILNHFQLTEAIFQDPDSEINFLFLSDFCERFVAHGYSPGLLRIMGSYSVVTNKNTPLGELMASFKTPKNLHEQVFGDVVGKSFDRNLNYRLMELDDEHCVVEARFTPELQELLKQKILGNEFVCEIRAGSFSSLTGYLNLPFSQVEERACIHRGDECCRYYIRFPQKVIVLAPTLSIH